MYELNNELAKARVEVNTPIRDNVGFGNPVGPFG